MRVIAGQARGQRLKVPRNVTRPSTDRLREALFSILAPRLESAVVLDLFAGSGALGIEALSRGASSAEFIEANRKAAAVIADNLRKTKLDENGRVIAMDAFDWIEKTHERYDLILADPPYASKADEDLAGRLLQHERLLKLLRDDGLLVIEVETEGELPQGRPEWVLQDRRVYGGSAILFYALKRAA